jgi:hypothetical protein
MFQRKDLPFCQAVELPTWQAGSSARPLSPAFSDIRILEPGVPYGAAWKCS